MLFHPLLQTLIISLTYFTTTASLRPRAYNCENGKCIQKPIGSQNGTSFPVCELTCLKDGNVWPKPTIKNNVGNTSVPFTLDGISFAHDIAKREGKGIALLMHMQQLFRNDIDSAYRKYRRQSNKGKGLKIFVNVSNMAEIDIGLKTSESYILVTSCNKDPIQVYILANTSFGARHALETLHQLTAYDDVSETLHIACGVNIEDHPSFAYRGLLLDTARHFYSVDSIRHLLDAMSFSKFNRFHWHMSDTQSFPIQMVSEPNLTAYGAYSPDKVYSRADIKSLVAHARSRGIAIVPEIDAPSHVGEGWQWGKAAGLEDLVLCLQDGCFGPPCGYLNATNPEIYRVLGNVYSELLRLMPGDLFHLGADEVDFTCWNKTKAVHQWLKNHGKNSDRDGFFALWGDFQNKALQKLKNSSKCRTPPKAILWTSHLTTDKSEEYLLPNVSDYVIEVWSFSDTNDVPDLVNKGFDIIVANADLWYLDCGFGSWVAEGNNWCGRYRDWATMYENRPYRSYSGNWTISDAAKRQQIIGGEGCIWSESIDEHSLDMKIWPRAAAIAERLWSDPEECWIHANDRMQLLRDRLVERGVRADPLQPEWCVRNQGACIASQEMAAEFLVPNSCYKKPELNATTVN